MSQQQNQPPKPTNPFASPRPPSAPAAPTASRFGSSPAQPPGGNNPPPPAPPPAPPRPSSLSSRLGPTKMNWRIVPVNPALVRFDLNGLGDPFYRLLGKRLKIDFGDPEALFNAFQAGGDDVNEIAARLDEAWADYQLRGAVLLYPWTKELPQTLAGRIMSDDESQPDEHYDDDKRKPPTILRVFDLLLCLNVLGRTRANILLPNAPLALEKQYLSQSLYTDDPRLIALAQATGCLEESLLQ